MDYRQKTILCGLISEYIRTGIPVSSAALVKSLGIELSPATIRNIYKILDEDGLLEQPHTSAGRVPTDRGYRVYVDEIQARADQLRGHLQLQVRYENLLEKHGSGLFALTVLLSQLSCTLALISQLPGGQFEQSGLSKLVELADEETQILEEASIFLDHVRQYAPHISELGDEQTNVFIGEENPYFSSSHTSFLMKLVHQSARPDMVIMIIGPKRMNYQRNLAFMEEVAKLAS